MTSTPPADAHPFGEAVPGEAVPARHAINPTEGYTPRGRFARRSDGKPIRIDNLPGKEPFMTPPTAVLPAPSAAPAIDHNVYGCIVAVSRELAQEGIAKGRSNAQQGYKFRGIDDVFNALAPLLAKYKLVILPRVLSRSVTERTTQKGGVLFYVTVEAEFDFVSAADGSLHTVKTYGEAMDSADKATNKAMSAAYKYAAFQTFCIPTEGDNDADAQTHEVQPRSSARPAFTPVPPARTDDGPDLGTADPDGLPEGYHLIHDYKPDGDWHHVIWGHDAQGGRMTYKTKLAKIGLEAKAAFDRHEPVRIHCNKFPFLDKVERLGVTMEQIASSQFRYDDPAFCNGCGAPTDRCSCPR